MNKDFILMHYEICYPLRCYFDIEGDNLILKTEIIRIDQSIAGWESQLDHAAEVIRQGGLVAFPTETVYGLGANTFDIKAIENIYKAKGRPSDNPLIVHIAEPEDLKGLVRSVPSSAEMLMDAFWPGPLTMIMPKSDKIPSRITAGLDTVAIRMPSHPIARALIKKCGVPIAAPSANSSGRPSPTLAKHVIEDLSGKIDVIIDGGSAQVGLESTVLDVTVDPPMILRPGGITREQLTALLGNVAADAAIIGANSSTPPRSPGMKYRHYAPKAPFILFQGQASHVAKEIAARADEALSEGKSVGILITEETADEYRKDLFEHCKILCLGTRRAPESLAANLFKCLRDFDSSGVDIILAEAPDNSGIGVAVMNRMVKASGGNIIKL